ncbi:MAG: hypothetical protein ABFD79_05045 [Phycisphaerales bacterium]
MKLSGILDTSLGNFLCLRGFAKLGDLNKISEAKDYQRGIDKKHKEEIAAFVDKGEFHFYPEVILGTPVTENNEETLNEIIKKIGIGEKFIFKFGKKVLKGFFSKSISSEEGRAYDYLCRGILSFDNSLIKSEDFKKFSRIDGNHRLSIIGSNGSNYNNIVTPFCLVFFRNEKEDEKFGAALFHNINHKALPLTVEDNLRLILENKELFPDDILKNSTSFGWEYYFARVLIQKLETCNLDSLVKVFDQRERTVCLELFKYLLNKNIIPRKMRLKNTSTLTTCQKVFRALKTVNSIYEEKELRNNTSIGLLIAFVYFTLLDRRDGTKKIEQFENWIKKSHLTKIKGVEAESIITIFENILISRKRQIFISMQFDKPSEPTYNAIKECVDKINLKHKLEIKLRPVRIDNFDKGFSYVITDEILELIESCGLFIADLTFGNKNVYHELGYLMGLNQAQGFDHSNFILIVKNQTNLEKKIGFNLRSYKHLRFNEPIDLLSELTKIIETYYNLN